MGTIFLGFLVILILHSLILVSQKLLWEINLIFVQLNFRAIINHFTPKIDSWAAVNHLTSLSSEQVRFLGTDLMLPVRRTKKYSC